MPAIEKTPSVEVAAHVVELEVGGGELHGVHGEFGVDEHVQADQAAVLDDQPVIVGRVGWGLACAVAEGGRQLVVDALDRDPDRPRHREGVGRRHVVELEVGGVECRRRPR